MRHAYVTRRVLVCLAHVYVAIEVLVDDDILLGLARRLRLVDGAGRTDPPRTAHGSQTREGETRWERGRGRRQGVMARVAAEMAALVSLCSAVTSCAHAMLCL